MKSSILKLYSKLFDFKYRFLGNRYKEWRKLGMALNHKIIKEIPKDVMLEAGGDLRMLGKNGAIVFGSESEMAYLQDRAIFDIEKEGKRGIENFIGKYMYHPPQICFANLNGGTRKSLKLSLKAIFLAGDDA